MGSASLHSAPASPAFSIEEGELALRWASLVAPWGYRVIVCLSRKDADEALLIYLPGMAAPAFVLKRLGQAVLVIDCLGMILRFPTLADALLILLPHPGPSRWRLYDDERPACLLGLPRSMIKPGYGRRNTLAGRLQASWRRLRQRISSP